MRIADALHQARAAGVDRLDAQLMLSQLLSQPRAWLLAHDDAVLDARQAACYTEQLARRASGEPLAYIVGELPFCGLRLTTTPAVLIPRPETEGLVEWALELLPEDTAAEVADLGTGSGAIALAIARARPRARVCATDASAAALDVARANARRHGLARVEFVAGDWWVPLAGRRFDLVVSNPPYIASDDPHLAALGHEPRSALTPGGDGLDALRRIVRAAPDHLRPGAWLLLEHGHDQAQALQTLLIDHGLQGVHMREDLAGLARCTGARRR